MIFETQSIMFYYSKANLPQNFIDKKYIFKNDINFFSLSFARSIQYFLIINNFHHHYNHYLTCFQYSSGNDCERNRVQSKDDFFFENTNFLFISKISS